VRHDLIWTVLIVLGEVGGVLKKAMADTNLSVKMLALGIISKIAIGMGQPFDKHTRLLTAPVASVCADQKATTRSAAMSTLSAMANACAGLDSMYPGLATSLETNNPALRSSVLGWMGERLLAESPSSGADLAPLAAPIISCLEDRNGDVRKGAGSVLPFVVASAGFDYVMEQTSSLKPASRAIIIPLINNARGSAAAPGQVAPAPAAAHAKAAASAPAVKTVKAQVANRSAPGSPAYAAAPSIKPPARSLAMKALSLAPATRPTSNPGGDERPTGLPKPKTMARPASAASHQPSTASSATFASASTSRVAPFITTAPEPRLARQKKDSNRWILEASPKADLTEYLQSQMEPHVVPELFTQLFSKDHRAEEDYMAALSSLSESYSDKAATTYHLPEDEMATLQLANVDLALKYAAIKLLSNNTQMANRCLEVIAHVVETIQRMNERFSDAEAKLFVPALIFKVSERLGD
jgi:cytoskeleton-associated protein 5